MNLVLKHLEDKTTEARERFETMQRSGAPASMREAAFQDFLLADAAARGAFAALYPNRSGLYLKEVSA